MLGLTAPCGRSVKVTAAFSASVSRQTVGRPTLSSTELLTVSTPSLPIVSPDTQLRASSNHQRLMVGPGGSCGAGSNRSCEIAA
jgi:hypothetical protein